MMVRLYPQSRNRSTLSLRVKTVTASPWSVLVLRSMYRSCPRPSPSVSSAADGSGYLLLDRFRTNRWFVRHSLQEVEVPLPTFSRASLDVGVVPLTPCRFTRPVTRKNSAIAGVLVRWKPMWDRYNWNLSLRCIGCAKDRAV